LKKKERAGKRPTGSARIIGQRGHANSGGGIWGAKNGREQRGKWKEKVGKERTGNRRQPSGEESFAGFWAKQFLPSATPTNVKGWGGQASKRPAPKFLVFTASKKKALAPPGKDRPPTCGKGFKKDWLGGGSRVTGQALRKTFCKGQQTKTRP